MGNAFYFPYWNPNGHYELNLANQVERDIAVTLIVLNKEAMKRVAAGEKADRSQMGNKSSFRNEKFNLKPFIITGEWQLPNTGVFEFDFMYLIDVPDPKDVMPDDQVQLLIQWFKQRADEDKADPKELASAFIGISDLLTFRSDQLGLLVDIFDDAHWKTEVFISGVARVCDIRNYDFIKHRVKFAEAIRAIYRRFGILNLFNPFRPNGSYRLDLSIYEEKIVCKMLLELARIEGYAQMSNVSLDGKVIETVNKEFVDKLGDSGIFEGTYIC